MKNMKKILLLLLTVLMIMSSVAMIVAHAEEGAEHTCADVSPKDHYCDDATCGKAMKSTAAKSDIRVPGGGKWTDVDFGEATFPIVGHRYEVSFSTEMFSPKRPAIVVANLTTQGVVNNAVVERTGALGWGFQNSNTQSAWQLGDTPQDGNASDRMNSVKNWHITPDIGAKNHRDLKILVDGISNKMVLYAKVKGEYEPVDVMPVLSWNSSNLDIRTYLYDSLSAGEFVKFKNITVTELCTDTDKNHVCDYCGESTLKTVNVDFTGNGDGYFYGNTKGNGYSTEYSVSADGKVLSLTKATGKADRYMGIQIIDMPVVNHKYEVTYWIKDTTDTNDWQMFHPISNQQGYAGHSAYPDQMGYSKDQSASPVVPLTASDAQKADANGVRYMKVIVDGVNKTMSAYCKVGDEYVLIDENRAMYGNVSGRAYLCPNLRAYYPFSTGELAVGDVVIKEMCPEKTGDGDHVCDLGCGAIITDHTVGDITEKVDATCTTAGNHAYYTCTECSKHVDKDKTTVLDSIVIDALGHTFGEWTVTKAATLDEAGEKQRTCSVCGAVETEEIAKLVADDTDDDDDDADEEEKKGLSGGAIAGISIAAVVVVGAGGFSIYWFGIKKSTFAALKAVFKKKG